MRALAAVIAVPLLAQEGVNFFGVEKERAMGREYAAEVRRASQSLGDPVVDAYVRRIASRLLEATRERPFDLNFEVILDGDHTEPLCLPGGFIFIPAAFFIAAETEAEFAAMLAHCIGHVVLRHGTRSASRAEVLKMASIPLIYMGGWHGAHTDTRGGVSLVPQSFLPFQRKYELEADAFGLELSARAGYPAVGLRQYVARMQPPDTKNSALPPRDLRLANIDDVTRSLPPSAQPANGEYLRIQELVRKATPSPERPRPTLRR